ncbi:MAG: hypothetical protein IJV36_02345 [Prevotella sp.]|nr:hypothetical protein [Prevotella sp.]MBR1789348.1 hypothetical protein [Bacteroidaceae bacterium]
MDRKKLFVNKVVLLSVLLAAFVGDVLATSTYYYSVTANVESSGLGTVYVNNQATDAADRNYQTSSTVNGNGNGLSLVNSATASIYLYVQPHNQYTSIDRWERTYDRTTERIAGNVPELVETISFSGGQRNRTQYTYTVYFVEQTGLVKAVSTNAASGTTGVSNPDNKEGDVITLTANPDVANGVIFLGWRLNNTGEGDFISTDRELTITVTESATYYAYFSDKATTVYCRFKNNKTGRYLSVIGDVKAQDHEGTLQGRKANDGFIFAGSLKMISEEEAKGNPSTVFKRTGTAVGTNVWENVGLSSLNAPFSIMTGDRYPIRIENIGGSYRISTPYTLQSGGTTQDARSYLRDTGDETPTMETIFGRTPAEISNFNIDWTVYTLTEETVEGAFGANAKEKYTKDGKYYTTMFADFPYKLLDGVKAYYLPLDESCYDEENNAVKFVEIESGIVPANMAVVLECLNTGDTNNRLLPLTDNVPEIVPSNSTFLKGYIRLNGNTVPNNSKTMWVLSTGTLKGLGFYHYSGDNMNPFKAYLELPEEVDDNPLSKTARFVFGDSGNISDVTIPMSSLFTEDNDDSSVFDLYGRRVFNPTRGIYVKRGKKIVVK